MTTDRIYQGEDDRWYFNVRGNLAKGPYVTYLDAEDALDQHVSRCYRPTHSSAWPSSWPSTWPDALRALRLTRRTTSQPRHP